MIIQNNIKEINYGQIMKYLRAYLHLKQVIIPEPSQELREITIEALDWYTAYTHSKMRDLDIKHVRQAIAVSIANREITLRDIEDLRFRRSQGVAG